MAKIQTFSAISPQPLRRAWTTFAVIAAWLFVTFAPAGLPADASRTSGDTRATTSSAYYKSEYRQDAATRWPPIARISELSTAYYKSEYRQDSATQRPPIAQTVARDAARKQKIYRPWFRYRRNGYQPPKRWIAGHRFQTDRNELGRLFWWNRVWRQWFLTR